MRSSRSGAGGRAEELRNATGSQLDSDKTMEKLLSLIQQILKFLAVAPTCRQANLETETALHEECWPCGSIIGNIIPWAVQRFVELPGRAYEIVVWKTTGLACMLV